jgi:hypothetical protein
MGMTLELIAPTEQTEEKTDGGQTKPPQNPPEANPDPDPEPEPTTTEPEVIEQIPDEKPSLDKDPVEWLPNHFIDTIQGTPTINRKGYCVICSKFGVSVKAEPVVRSSETEFEYAEFKAVATDADGNEYTGFGTAHVERDDDKYMLNELAETRASKRAATWATGLGLSAIEEMQ